MTDKTMIDDVREKAHELFGWASNLGGFDDAVNELFDYIMTMRQSQQAQGEAEAVQHFVNSMIDAFECGFIDSNTLTLATIYQVMRNHCKDGFGIEVEPLVVAWGETTARECAAPPAPSAVPEVSDHNVRLISQSMAFLASAIKSGEPWSDQCEHIYERAQNTLNEIAPAAVPDGQPSIREELQAQLSEARAECERLKAAGNKLYSEVMLWAPTIRDGETVHAVRDWGNEVFPRPSAAPRRRG